MASTSKIKRKVITESKVETSTQEVKEVKPEIKDTLSHEHLKYLEVFSRDTENAKLSMALEEQSLRNMLLSLELLQIKIEKQRILLASKDQKYKISVEKFTNYKKEIWPDYGLNISEPMGYDPISGEIKRQ
jgi:hypothetical protein